VEGRAKEGLGVMERLLRVAPLDIFFRGQRLSYFVFARQYERALEEVERIRELDPDCVGVNVVGTYRGLGRFEEAHRANIALHRRGRTTLDPIRELLERGWAEGGWEGSWRAWLERMTLIDWLSRYLIADVYATIGETDEAFAWLERGYRERDPIMAELKSNPVVDPLRSDPRFDDLLRRIGFPEE
jgi:tetratricopeptide (TPR) repeat protein